MLISKSLFNKCIKSGIFPTEFKIAARKLLFRKCERTKNDRLTSLISNIIKIFKKILKTKKIKILDKYKVISFQTGGIHEKCYNTINWKSLSLAKERNAFTLCICRPCRGRRYRKSPTFAGDPRKNRYHKNFFGLIPKLPPR